MLGVVAIGGYAVYRAITNKPALPRSEDTTPILKTPPAAPIRLALKNSPDTWYKGRVEGDPTATRADLLKALQDFGFTNITTYMTADEGGDDIAIVKGTPGPGTRWFYAQWGGKDMADAVLPPSIVQMSYAATPPKKKAGTAGVLYPTLGRQRWVG